MTSQEIAAPVSRRVYFNPTVRKAFRAWFIENSAAGKLFGKRNGKGRLLATKKRPQGQTLQALSLYSSLLHIRNGEFLLLHRRFCCRITDGRNAEHLVVLRHAELR